MPKGIHTFEEKLYHLSGSKEMKEYIEKHHITELFNHITVTLTKEMPEDPYDAIVKMLKEGQEDANKTETAA